MFLEAETSFGLGILQQFPVNESFVFSPLSIALALSLVHTGAKGATKSQINDAICKDANDDQLKQHYGFFTNSFKSIQEGVEVNVANKVFVSQMFPIKTSYLEAIKNAYNASAENLDFTNAAKSAEIMNQFVNEQTKGNIKDIINKNQVNGGVAAFLINALYLKADWRGPFMKRYTHNQTFQSSENSNRQIPFMNSWKTYSGYYANDELELLSKEYKDNRYKFNVFLPKGKFGLAGFLKNLDAKKFQDLLTKAQITKIDLTIPKMKVETSKEVKKMLQKAGISLIFDKEKAELGEMSDKPVFVGDVTHKAIIEVDEQGTTAAAATVVRMPAGSSGMKPPPIPHFKADHPFLYSVTFNNHPLCVGIFA